MAEIPKALVDYAMQADGHGLVGVCSKIKLPQLKVITEELLAGGMAAAIDVDMAAVEKMELKATLLEPKTEVLTLFGLGNGNEKPYTFRSALKGKGAAESLVVKVKGNLNDIDISDIERKKPTETEVMISLTQFGLFRSGKELIFIDAEAGIIRVNGVNKRGDINTILGV